MSKAGVRDRGVHPESQDYDCVIRPDTTQGFSRNNSYQIWTYGEHVANEYTVDAAKAYIEQIYGSVPWEKLPGDTDAHHDRVWGWTTEFNDPKWYLVVRRLPRLG